MVVARRLKPLLPLTHHGVILVRDAFRTHHPLGGLCTALDASPTPWLFLVACDTPLVQRQLLTSLWHHRKHTLSVVVRLDDKRQPLCALYHRGCSPFAHTAISNGNRSLQHLLTQVTPRELSLEDLLLADPQRLSFLDADTPDALDHLRSFNQ